MITPGPPILVFFFTPMAEHYGGGEKSSTRLEMSLCASHWRLQSPDTLRLTATSLVLAIIDAGDQETSKQGLVSPTLKVRERSVA